MVPITSEMVADFAAIEHLIEIGLEINSRAQRYCRDSGEIYRHFS